MCLAFAKQAWTHRYISVPILSKACYVKLFDLKHTCSVLENKKSMHMIGINLEHLPVESSEGFAFLNHEKELMYNGGSFASCSACLRYVCSKLILALHTAEAALVGIQAEPSILDVYWLLPQEQLEFLRISKGASSPLLKFAACQEPNGHFL